MQHDTLRRVDRPNGTGYKGLIQTSYGALTRVFGEPHRLGEDWIKQSDGKTNAEWAFQLGTMIITIHDFKEYKSAPTEVINWHIGGKGAPEQVVGFINRELQKAGEETKVMHLQQHGANK